MFLELEVVSSFFATKYYINNGEDLVYKGVNSWGWLFSNTLIHNSSLNTLASVNKKWSIYKPTYIIKHGNSTSILQIKSSWKGYYKCSNNTDVYQLISHKGLKTSIFLNDIQIGYYEQNELEWLETRKYQIHLNPDADQPLICSIIISLDNYKNGKDADRGTTFYVGKLTPEIKPFDESWRPKNKNDNKV
ncbi:hypothetical protein BFP72_03260 [Reichenbachiella sp. 5M10]|uniref:hypothetical protein n=1 Tax=Reichenbachiella sp. 5M10 TaxID=1889772 RepID=UPI000C159C6D|nr:hypothetical protein [Reichenbachiella sp. 5M10]PIB34500.1 hypothetical protein BFP72_03260 [Reichenbachiella sp. 5M10]